MARDVPGILPSHWRQKGEKLDDYHKRLDAEIVKTREDVRDYEQEIKSNPSGELFRLSGTMKSRLSNLKLMRQNVIPQPRKRPEPVAESEAPPRVPKRFGFHQLEGEDMQLYHCGPTAIRTASGRDDLSVMDCAIPAMRPGLQEMAEMGTIWSHPGGFPAGSLTTVLKDKLGFTPIDDLKGRGVVSVIEELENRGYTHGTIGTRDHIFGFRDGVIYDIGDPRDQTNYIFEPAIGVLASREAPSADRQAWLDAEIAEVRASGEAREFCLRALTLAEKRLTSLMGQENVADRPDEVQEAVNAVARWRHYCTTGNIAPDKVICEQEISAVKENIDGLQSRQSESNKRTLRSLQKVLESWQVRCAESELETADLCQHRKKATAANLAAVEKEIVEARKPGYRPAKRKRWRHGGSPEQALAYLLRYRDQQKIELSNWERLCAMDLTKPYKPPKKTYFDPYPAAPARRVAAKPKVVKPKTVKATAAKPKTPAKPKAAAPVKATAKKGVKATAAATKAAAKPKVAAKKATVKAVKAKSPAAKKGAAPARRRTPRKEPVVAGALPTVSIAR